jgi:hypothetical protein
LAREKEDAQRRYVRERLGGLILGYKVRRVMQFNRQVSSLRIEIQELIKFITILRVEINENIRASQTKGINTVNIFHI